MLTLPSLTMLRMMRTYPTVMSMLTLMKHLKMSLKSHSHNQIRRRPNHQVQAKIRSSSCHTRLKTLTWLRTEATAFTRVQMEDATLTSWTQPVEPPWTLPMTTRRLLVRQVRLVVCVGTRRAESMCHVQTTRTAPRVRR